MKRFRFFIITLPVVLMVYSSASTQQSGSIKKLPSTHGMRSRKIDVKHVAIDLRFDWQKKQAYGTTTITLSPFNPTNVITLDAGMLTINSITLPGGSSLKFVYDGGDKNDGLAITLDHVYAADEDLTIKIDYHTNWINKADPNNIWGSFGKGIRFQAPTSTTPIKRRQIWSSGEPESNRYWFPCYDAPNDLRTTEFTATVDKKLMAISNGTLVETKENADGTRSFHYKTNDPYPNYLTSFVIGEYADVKQNYKDITLHSFGYPDEKTAVEATTVRLSDMIKFFSETTGMKYPYPQYSQVMVQDYPFPGLNGQHTATTISDNMIDGYTTHADFFYLWDGVEAQSLASQWFGNLIAAKDWSDIWLNASFSHYFDGLYTDYKNGHDEYLTYYLNILDMPAVLGDWTAGYRHPIVTKNFSDIGVFTSDNYIKVRGSLVLRMLRKQLGDDNFFKAIRQYVKSNAGKQVTTADFQKSIEETTGESIEWFFDQWLYKMGHPLFEVTKTYDNAKKKLTLHVKQTQQIDHNDEYPQVEFFKGKIEIEIDGKIELVWLEPKLENTFTFNAKQEPRLINFDYENTWIKEMIFEKSFNELFYQLENDKDILGRSSAISALVTTGKDEKTSKDDKAKICTALRNIVLSKSYWRLRIYAMTQLRGLVSPEADKMTVDMLLEVIKNDKSWVRASAITSLGMTKNAKYAGLYLSYLTDESERVVNASAVALGKTKSPKAFAALVKLKDKPSWKSQSLISCLNGLKELGDPRGADVALKALSDKTLPRWWLAVSTWDYPIAAAETLVALGKARKAYPMIFERFKKSMTEDDYNDIFSNVLLITTLADPGGQEAFDMLKAKFKEDANAMVAVNQYEAQFKDAIKKKS